MPTAQSIIFLHTTYELLVQQLNNRECFKRGSPVLLAGTMVEVRTSPVFGTGGAPECGFWKSRIQSPIQMHRETKEEEMTTTDG